jgi:hypothetical protein
MDLKALDKSMAVPAIALALLYARDIERKGYSDSDATEAVHVIAREVRDITQKWSTADQREAREVAERIIAEFAAKPQSWRQVVTGLAGKVCGGINPPAA